MNFNPVLSAFQGAVLSADNVHHFSRLTEKGGNEDQIDYVVGSIRRFLDQSQYIFNGKISQSAVAEVRKFALYIVLNADLPELEQLVELEDISTVIWTLPTVPKYLMCELLWSLHMETFIYEIISFANPQLALEVASAFLDHFKYFNPINCLEQLKLLSTSCYLLICRLHLFNLSSTECRNKSTVALNNLQQCLKYYTTPPNNYKLNELRKVDLYKYQGKSLYSLLQVIDESINNFTSCLNNNGPDIYKLTYEEKDLKSDYIPLKICESLNNILLECLNEANVAMLDTCKVLVMDVSVDVFCCWSEFEENDKSMQQTIGELCYKIHNKLSKINTISEHPLVSMIEQIVRKPVDINDTINVTEDNVILQNINNDNSESKTWIKALVFKEKLCDNLELLNIVASNLNIYSETEYCALYTVFNEYITSKGVNKDYVEALSVKIFEKFDKSKQIAILEERFSNKTLFDMNETVDFENSMTSLLNKLIDTPDADLTDVLTLFLQSPRKMYMRLFLLATENSHQTELSLKVMKLFEGFYDHYYSTETESCIIQIIQEVFDKHIETEAKQNNFISFISGLKNDNVISGTKLLLLIVMTNMHKAILNKNISGLNVQIKLLRKAYKLEELLQYRAPMLAMFAQVLEVVRWTITTYVAIAPPTLANTIELLMDLIKTYNNVVPVNESNWLKSKVKNLKPLNMYYFRMLWNPPGANYMEIISGMSIVHGVDLSSLTNWLAQVICSCTQREWYELWDSLGVFGNDTVLQMFSNTMCMLTYSEKSNRTDNSWACILNCYRNFIVITRYKYLMVPLTDSQVQSVIQNVVKIANMVKEENLQEFGTVLLPLFAYLAEKQSSYSINFFECLNENFSRAGLSSMVNKVFSNGTES